MKVICFSGNIGNQIFYCAFKDYIKRKNIDHKVFRYVIKGCPPVTVEKYFNLQLPENSYLINFFSFLVFYGEILIKKFLKSRLPSWLLCSRGEINENAVFFSNYLQDKYYYENLESHWLQIKMPNSLSVEYLEYEKQILSSNSICIHIRRGDYIQLGSTYANLSATDYYKKAIDIALEKFPNGRLFFFSDDLDFAKKNFSHYDSIFVDCNRGTDSYLDIKLMSLGKVNIMANSTFSYWGAYIGHENKMVICPSMWFNELSGRTAPNIMLNSWIKI